MQFINNCLKTVVTILLLTKHKYGIQPSFLLFEQCFIAGLAKTGFRFFKNLKSGKVQHAGFGF